MKREPMPTSIVQTKLFQGIDLHPRLQELGLDLPTLAGIVRRGEQARAQATDHDPINAAAWDAYRYRVRAIRDLLRPRGWTKDHDGGLEKTWSPDGRVVLITRSGDAGVGLAAAFPQPRRKTGSEIRDIVEEASLTLEPSWLNAKPTGAPPSAYAIYMLLVYRTGGLVRAELSQPTGFTDEETVMGWHERIILPEVDFSPAAEPDLPVLIADEIDVPVLRRK